MAYVTVDMNPEKIFGGIWKLSSAPEAALQKRLFSLYPGSEIQPTEKR